MGTEEGIRNATRTYLTQYYPQSLSTIPEEVLQVNFQQYLLFDNHLNRNLTPDISLILCRLLTLDSRIDVGQAWELWQKQ